MYHQAYDKYFSLKKEFIHYTCASIIFLIAFYLLPLEGFLYSNINRVIKLTKIQISLIPLALISFYLIFLFIALKVIAHYKTKQQSISACSKKTILYCQLVILTILIAPVFFPQRKPAASKHSVCRQNKSILVSRTSAKNFYIYSWTSKTRLLSHYYILLWLWMA